MLSSLRKLSLEIDRNALLKYVRLMKGLRLFNTLFTKINMNKFIHFSAFYQNNKQTSNLDKRRAEMMQRGLPKVEPIENVKHIIMVASGKGGVGKSTTAVNLATAMKIVKPENNIGLLDADIFGPSLPLMMNLHDTPLVDDNKRMIPLNNYGVKCMSMGFLIEEGSPVIWRGLMVMQALEKLMRGVNWGPVDYLIVDTPPGTGDTHLSLIQNLPIHGVILVTTPQSAALQVAKRGAVMFKKLNVPIIGLVENMSSIQCPKCETRVQLFGSGTVQLAAEIKATILQQIPLEQHISTCSDTGIPIVVNQPESEVSFAYKALAQEVIHFVESM